MKIQILALRAQGLSYKQIKAQLGCSLGTISYHCGEGQKEKQRLRRNKTGHTRALHNKAVRFHDRIHKARDFQRARIKVNGKTKLGAAAATFTWQDVIARFGQETECYLTGRKIDLLQPSTYQFDHIQPVSRGGASTIDNLGICCKEANAAKSDLSVAGLLALCKEMLEHNGYAVQK
jgi:5-methylcytosine-specific restriction endonuclease McrA